MYNLSVHPTEIILEYTNKQHQGDFTFVVFPFVKVIKKAPEMIAGELGDFLMQSNLPISNFNVAKGFLNIQLHHSFWLERLSALASEDEPGSSDIGKGKTIMVEFSSPNTNKPQHLGHVRNNLLGLSVSNILLHAGFKVIKSNLINDRGIHICKSMLAWKKFGNGETPETSGIKGDKLVGKYYVLSDKIYREQIKEMVAAGIEEEKAKKTAPFLVEAQQMLKDWEAGDPDTVELWKMMNSWVYKGFEATYNRMGVSFDKYYYESETYLLGKKLVEEGLEREIFFKKFNGSVWVDLTTDGLDEKLLLRSDGTSVYITQDLGTAQQKYDQFKMDTSVYVVGNEQDYHFKVLKLILKKLQKPYAEGIYHLSYGMVDLPSGRMKTREGTVVDADDLMQEMFETAKDRTLALGKTEGMNAEEMEKLFEMLGMGALKYYLLKVDPVKRMLFDPNESIDFQGNTGPFIQYTHARISSLLKGALDKNTHLKPDSVDETELDVLKLLNQFKSKCEEAARNYSPAVLAAYNYELARAYNRFYHDLSILGEPDAEKRNFRIELSRMTGKTIRTGMQLLGIEVPERM